jgi:hypothetical protein
MLWFVAAVVVAMIAVIDLMTNLHLLVTRRLRRRRTTRVALRAPVQHRRPPIDSDPSLGVETPLRELRDIPAA